MMIRDFLKTLRAFAHLTPDEVEYLLRLLETEVECNGNANAIAILDKVRETA